MKHLTNNLASNQ